MSKRARVLLFVLLFSLAVFSLVLFLALLRPRPETTTADKADRTIMMYVCGSNIESDDAHASDHFKQILQANFSKGESVRFVIMTGGSSKWHTEGELLYDPASGGKIGQGISTEYNQIWEAYGADEENDTYRGKMVLLDGDGISGDGANAKRSVDELMTDPDTLKAFINYAADRYPAVKYDLILCDHGGGVKEGFGSDDHDTDGSPMRFAEIINAIADNKVTKSGTKFDIVNFDACIMGCTEYSLALNDYADYYIASPHTIPSNGQYYMNWLNKLGEQPQINGYELGKIIVDDFYDYYLTMEKDDLDYESTLAVIDLKKLSDSSFTDDLLSLDKELAAQAGEFKIYDEMRSVDQSIHYVNMEFIDLGNFTSSVGVSVLETDGGSDENAYTGLSKALRSVLDNKDIIYAKGTGGIVSKEHFYIDETGKVVYGTCGTSGIYIYMPNVHSSSDPSDYTDALEKYCSTLPDGDKRKILFEQHVDTVLKYALVNHTGTAVGSLIVNGTPKSQIDYDRIRQMWRYDIDGGMDGEDCPWNTIIVHIADRMGGESVMKAWLEPVIRKQAEDAVGKEGITVYTVKEPEGTRPRVCFEGVKKQTFESVDIDVYASTTVADEYIKEQNWEDYFDSAHPFGFHIGTVNGVLDYGFEDWDDYNRWMQNESAAWDVPVPDKKWHAVKDADGVYHLADASQEDDGVTTTVCATGVIKDGDTAKGDPQEMTLSFKKGMLFSVNVHSPEGGYYTITPASMKGTIEITLCKLTELNGAEEVYIPVSRPFELNAENAPKIRLDYIDIDDIPDIKELNDSGEKAVYNVVVRDIYGTVYNIQDKVNDPSGVLYSIRLAEAEDAVYNGKEQMPVITVDGSVFGTEEKKVLTEGVDYKIYVEEPPVSEGTHKFLIVGMGEYTGSAEKSFSILPEPAV